MRKIDWKMLKDIKLPVGKNKFLKRLDWYIIKKFLGTYVFAIALIISIAVVFDFNEKMDRFMSHEAIISEFSASLEVKKITAMKTNSGLNRLAK